MKTNAYTFVAGIHGNEYMPILACASRSLLPIIANPRALAQGVRFTESDLNSAFNKAPEDYETRRAAEILALIPEDATVIDFHTFRAPSPPFVVLVDPSCLELALQTGIRNIVYMKHNIKKGGALINFRNGISVEVGQHATEESFHKTLDVIDALGMRRATENPHLYEVYETIQTVGNYTNFQESPEGFYPVLAGGAYDFQGLKARRVDVFR